MRETERERWERLSIQEAAARLGITESAVRKRARKGDLRSEKVVEGHNQCLYVFLDQEEERVPEPFREKYMRSLEERVNTLEDEVYRQQAIILFMSQSLQALTSASESPLTDTEEPEGADPRSDAPGPQRSSDRPW